MEMEANSKKGIVLSDLHSIDTAEREIILPDGTGTGWFITLAGPGHEKTIALADRNAKKSLRRQAQIEAAQINGKKYKPPETDVEEQRIDNVTSIVARIVTWRGLREEEDGPEIEFTEDVGRKMFLDPKMSWAFWQVVEYLADERSFMKRSATS